MAIIGKQTGPTEKMFDIPMRDVIESRQAGCDKSGNIVASRDSEVWNQVGMLEEEIKSIGRSIDTLCEILESAGVLMLLQKQNDDEDEDDGEEPASRVRLGESLQHLRFSLNHYTELIGIVTKRLGV